MKKYLQLKSVLNPLEIDFTNRPKTFNSSKIKSTAAFSNVASGLFSVVALFSLNQNILGQSVDLSTYVRVGRYDLPEPTRTTAPAHNLLAQEASAVTYNWDTKTLFIVGDGSTAVVQVSKTGQLINTMTLGQGSSPQGTEFYDTEGITYIGNNQFVMAEERDRQAVLFNYNEGTTLYRADTKTVKLGTSIGNIGTEGLSYDPATNGFIVLKEVDPMGIFQTGIDFTAGTATNGSPTTVNSVNLFDPALLGVLDVADVFALSNLPVPSGQPLDNSLLVLSQESAKVLHIDRNGTILNTLNIVSDPENPLTVVAQQHEGLTMDEDGTLYIVNENGGGDFDHPQLWVYKSSSQINQAPTAVALANTTNAILENSNTTSAIKVADITVTDDGLGTNNLTISGAAASFFEIKNSSLYIKAGTVLDYETKTNYAITINVDDTTIGSTPDATVDFALTVTDVAVETPPIATVIISEVAPWSSASSVGADWFEVTNNGTTALDITGWKVDDNSNSVSLAVALNGISSIAAGESVIFIEADPTIAATVIAKFKSTWFGTNIPANLQIGSYSGGGIGLSGTADAVNLFDAAGNLKANVTFGASTTNLTFNNAIGLNNTVVSTLSKAGVNDAFASADGTDQIGSPGSVGKLFISEVAPWSSGNSPVGADWFEVTNTKAVAIDISGWKVDDDSQSPAAAVALNGITVIKPGESVIFIETTDLATKKELFLSNWFGDKRPADLQIGNYTGGGIGLSSNGDQVNLFDGINDKPKASVRFGSSDTAAPYRTFDNAPGLNTIDVLLPKSIVAVNGAFTVAVTLNDVAHTPSSEIGSPGIIAAAASQTLSTNTPSEVANSFKVVAYPVPFDSSFQLDLASANDNEVQIQVYDMNGKLVEARQFDAAELKNQKIGSKYLSGIYIIVVSQAGQTKTERVIKK